MSDSFVMLILSLYRHCMGINQRKEPNMLKKSLLALCISLVSFTSWGSENPAVHEYMLDNGLKVIVKEDHRAPVVISQVWYKVGSSYEHNGITGVSHVLEHMMFKGTEKHAPGEFSRIISENGGSENAFTGRDYTAYFQQLEKSRLEVSFEMESDRMRNLKLLDEEFAKEVRVVMEERRLRTEDNPQSLTYEQFASTAFVNNPYGNPVIGWMNDLENMTNDDLRKWYEMWYAPNNATLVVVGDVDPEEVYQLAKKYYGVHKRGEVATIKPRVEAPQKGEKRLLVKAPAELPYMMMGYKVPTLTPEGNWEPYALEVLAAVLDGGKSARFEKLLVREKQIASSIGTGYGMTGLHNDMLTFSGTPAQGQTVEDLELAIREQVQRLHHELVSEEELARIKAQVVASDVYQRDSVYYQAMLIGTLETVGLSWKLLDKYVDRIRAITPQQIQQVAQKYLIDDNLTVANLIPQPIDSETAKRRMRGGGNHGH